MVNNKMSEDENLFQHKTTKELEEELGLYFVSEKKYFDSLSTIISDEDLLT